MKNKYFFISMVFTDEEKRERHKISARKFYQKHKEKIRERNKEYWENNKEYFKEWRQTPEGIKSRTLTNWKQLGLICEDYDSLYCHYLNATECDNCGVEFGEKGDGSGKFKCMDHCHETGKFRNFLCCRCNLLRR